MNTSKASSWRRDTAFLLGLIALSIMLGLGAGHAWQWSQQEPVVSRFDPVAMHIDSSKPIMIASSTCPACAAARRWLQERGVDYLELTADQSEEARAIARRLKVSLVPTFLIGEVRINGFVVDELQKRLPVVAVELKKK